MPSDVITIVVTTGIGVSVVAGVLSGVCYILIQGGKSKRRRNPALLWHCAVCGTYLRSCLAEDIKIVICVECEERVCKQRCSKYDCRRKGWTCYACLKRPSWIQTILQSLPLRNNNKGVFAVTTVSKRSENMDEFDLKRKREKMLVRDFIEKLVSSLLGASVDDASISRIYKDKHYDILFTKYHQELKDTIINLSSTLHSSICEANTSSAHTKLKYTIERIFEEASRLPSFRKLVENHASDFSDGEQTYEGLLATAILNKIILKHENDLPSTSTASIPDDQQNKKYTFKNGSWETEASDIDLDFSSLSSSDSNPSSTKYIDRVSWTIQQQIEEEASTEILDFDDRPLSRTNSLLSNSDSNWYLQRRQFHSSNSPVPVPMLVPNSLMNAKVLIGDKEAAETSDLSDATSDCENEDSTLKDDQFFAKSNEWPQMSDEDSSFDSGVREDEFSDKKFYGSIPKREIGANDENVEDEPLESQYFDKYSSLSEANLRFGRDYYTRQASSPSGKLKREEEEDIWPSENNSENNNNSYELFRAIPATSDNDLNADSISQLTNNSDLSLINYYDVENSKVYVRAPDDNQKFEVKLNDKEVLIPDLNEFVKDTASETIILTEPKVRFPEPSSVETKEKTKDIPPKISEKLEQSAPVLDKTSQSNTSLPGKTAKKSDNTWIKQIYSNPTVRNFALTNREKIPFEYDSNETKQVANVAKPKIDYKSNDANSSSNFSIQDATEDINNNFSLEFSDNGSIQEDQLDEVDEIEMLKEQRLVAHRLGEFSSSFPNLAKINSSDKKPNKISPNVTKAETEPELEDTLPNKFVSVKDLRKIFENKDVSSHKDKPMHSLTARSISKNTKEKLKNVTSE
ncbi:uncharacterized protein LOC123013208 isoform X2 [Tribolium madens]|uniref:uncharacterized protein LOC123013208 isoform X2 n=1 Tax=Tribolium madens TaxID=41895 RepID=UPI001CF72E08|nr:uncharacterized protein LOC123013208 isoform X2 [Tribolium madens]